MTDCTIGAIDICDINYLLLDASFCLYHALHFRYVDFTGFSCLYMMVVTSSLFVGFPRSVNVLFGVCMLGRLSYKLLVAQFYHVNIVYSCLGKKKLLSGLKLKLIEWCNMKWPM